MQYTQYTLYNYMLFTGSEVRTGKYFPKVSEVSRGLRSGPRPKDASEAEGKYFFSTDRPKR